MRNDTEAPKKEDFMPIAQAHMNQTEALRQNPHAICPEHILGNLTIVQVAYRGFDGLDHQGQIVVHRDMKVDVLAFFMLLHDCEFPLQSVIPVSHPEIAWDDEKSMLANNSSGWNYRMVAGTNRVSEHAFGRAIDINPVQNPYFRSGRVSPEGAVYNPAAPGTLCADDTIVGFMKSLGWEWGGDWTDYKDYHHFQKPA